MLFDRAAKGKKSKELKGELKDLKKSLLNAGGEKAYVNEALRDYQAALEQGDTLREQYEEARSHLAQSRAAIERLLECMKESPVSEVKKSLDELMGDLDQVYHDCSIRDDDLDFQSTIQSLKQMAAEYEEHAAKAQTEAGSKLAAIMLRSELENVAAVLKDAAGWEEPDFFALAYYLGHENRGSLREMENAQQLSGGLLRRAFLEPVSGTVPPGRGGADGAFYDAQVYLQHGRKPVKQLKNAEERTI